MCSNIPGQVQVEVDLQLKKQETQKKKKKITMGRKQTNKKRTKQPENVQ